jgi:hypothetical protein
MNLVYVSLCCTALLWSHVACYIWNCFGHVIRLSDDQVMWLEESALRSALRLLALTCVHLRLLLGFRMGQLDRTDDVDDHAGMVRRTSGSVDWVMWAEESALRVCLVWSCGGFQLHSVSLA